MNDLEKSMKKRFKNIKKYEEEKEKKTKKYFEDFNNHRKEVYNNKIKLNNQNREFLERQGKIRNKYKK